MSERSAYNGYRKVLEALPDALADEEPGRKPNDVILSEVAIEVTQALERAIGAKVIQVIVTDREGLAAEVLALLAAQNYAFAALLEASQYSGEADFVRR